MVLLLTSMALFTASCATKKEEQTAVTGEELYKTVVEFVKLGEHRTASNADLATSAWLKASLDSIGARTEFVEFPLSQFFFEEGKLTVDSQSIDLFPVWPVKQGVQLSLAGLAIDGDSLKDKTFVKGKIALTRLAHQHGVSTLESAEQINALIHAGAIAVLVVPQNSTGEIVALNTYDQQPAWEVPVYEIAPKDTGLVQTSISAQQSITLSVKGEVKDVTARNVLAKIGTGKQYVVVSTPISGWFRTGGERGPGIAVWLGLAKWAKANEDKFHKYTFVFTGNSGHELDNMGAKVFAEKAAPKVADTRLWIHLGAAVAVKAWKEEQGEWILTDSVDSNRNIYYDASVAHAFETSFGKLNAIKVKGTEQNKETVKPGGEGIIYKNKGYKNLVSIAYAHRLHHVKTDDEHLTSPALLLELEKTVQEFITLELK